MANTFTREVFTPEQVCTNLGITQGAWAFRYRHTSEPWTLVVATLGKPNSGALSLGGFRIVPAARAATQGFDPMQEAVGLALGMDEKVYWSRLMKIGGPRGMKEIHNIVGGKCVLLTENNSRVGEAKDFAMLDFAIECLHDLEKTHGIWLVTGQDLGHGTLSDGKTHSLSYMSSRFHGSVSEDTSQPTGEGNFYALKGMLEGSGTPLAQASVAFLGCGNVGERVLRGALSEKVTAYAIEPSPAKAPVLNELGVNVCSADNKQTLLSQKIEAVCVNANGGTLDSQTIKNICANPSLKVVCGSENLTMPNAADEELLSAAGKLYCPTELGGMMGYLTAVEEYLTKRSKEPFNVAVLFESARKLETPCRQAAELCLKEKGLNFSEAIRRLHT